MLKIENLCVNYGGIKALRGINMEIPENKIVSLVGANGAGKSTALRAIIGLVKTTSGKVIYDGQDITTMKTKDIVKKGLVLVPEGRRVFSDLTVDENLMLGAYARDDKSEIKKDIARMKGFFPILGQRSWQLAGTLSGGEQQMLAVSRALMSRPKLLMMDEPSLGLAPLIVKNIFEIIKEIHKQGVTILLIEQNANAALRIADKAYVLEIGKIILEGTGRELLANDDVKKAYLGA
ncbi:MAG: ABC transporter ATP-binding protein [Alkaliphilus sp.]